MKKIVTCLALTSVLLFGVACGDVKQGVSLSSVVKNGEIVKTGTELNYTSSDARLAAFLNDFYSRHVRNGADKIDTQQLGRGETFQKLWEADSLVWFDSSLDGLGTYDGMQNLKSYLSNIDLDRFGYVFCAPNIAHQDNQRAWSTWGWAFPGYSDTYNNGVNYDQTFGENFRYADTDWTVNGEAGKAVGGYLDFSYNGGKNDTLFIESCEVGDDGNGLNTLEYSPVVEIELRLEDLSESAGVATSDIEDVYFCWQTKEGGDEWFKVAQKAFSVNPTDFSSYTFLGTFFPMYLHADWDDKHVTRVGLEIVPKTGKNLTVNGKLNYLYFMGDNVNSVNSGNYIGALEKYVTFNNDIEFLKTQITKARRTILFQMHALNGKDGLVTLNYLRGHSLSTNGGYYNQNGFWDMYPTGNLNAEANAYFYLALRSLAKLERYLTDAGVTVNEIASIDDPYLREGYPSIVYDLTADDLDALAEKVKANMCKNVSDGGLWNDKTGRFAWAVYDEAPLTGNEGEAMDYGHTELNLLIVSLGIATEAQVTSIFDWLDGKRIVEGDDATGDDIYKYEFAPRTTTRNNLYDHNPMWRETSWETSCQNGGTALFFSYYDLLSRCQNLGVENAYTRLKAIENWYYDVWSFGGEGTGFYAEYYQYKQDNTEDGDSDSWKLQGGSYGNGAVGIPGEFHESALLYASVPQMFFGLDATKYKTLSISPELPKEIDWFGLENLMYSGIKYDCVIQNDSVIISGVRGTVNGEKIQVNFKKPKGNYSVSVNGVKTSEFVENGEYVTVTVPLGKTVVEIKQ